MRFLAIALLLCGCHGNSACDSAEENLPKCGLEYYGDENCELLTENCTNDDLVALDALFQCLGNNCGGSPECDIHARRLTGECYRDLTP